MQTANKSKFTEGWLIKNFIDGTNSPCIAALINTNKKANLLAAVNKWLAVGLNVTFE